MTMLEAQAQRDTVARYVAVARRLADTPRSRIKRSDFAIEWRTGTGSRRYLVVDRPEDHFVKGQA